MQILFASGIFLAVSIVSIVFASKWSGSFWQPAEYFVLVLAFLGVMISIAEIEVSRRAQAKSNALANVQASKANLLYRTEWVMNACDVWWSDVLNQTNESPSKCLRPHPSLAGTTCVSSCRAAHLVGQHRMHAYTPDEEQSAAKNLFFNICFNGADDIGMCAGLRDYRDAAETRATLSNESSIYDHFANFNVSLIAQVLLAIALGLQTGKIRRDFGSAV